MKQFIISEHDEQATLFTWAGIISKRIPELDLLFAIPNGGDRHPIVAAKLKAEGVKPGIPDVFLPVARDGFHGLFIEMKRKKGGSLSGAQKQRISQLKNQGYRVEVCKGFEAARDVILNYLEV